MNINRNTYETYFLLYVDNELSAEEKVAVEIFVEENPDLKPELDMLQEAVLSIDNAEIFPDKSCLFRYEEQGLINAVNYEEYFVRFVDNELTADEHKQVLEFVAANPQFKEEFELIQQCKIEPDTTVFYKNKEELFRYEEDEKVVPFNWRRIAVAAVVVLMLGSATWYAINQDSNGSSQGLATVPAKKTTEAKKSQPEAKTAVAEPANEGAREEVINAVKSEVNVEPVTPSYAANKQEEKKSLKQSNKKIEPIVQQETPDMAAVQVKETKVDPARVTVGTTETGSEVKAIDEAIDENTLRSRSGMNAMAAASTPQQQESNVVYIANTSVNKKNKLRGFFRTASRIVEKATSFEPSQNEDKSGIRIANFEIDLK